MSEQRRSIGLLVVVWLAPAVAAADPLSQADIAYSRVEFGETQRLAKAALAVGGYDRAQLIRIYFLGVSAAAEGKDEDSLDAFKHLLALDPDTKLDRGLSPKMQGPMLEARGTPPPPLACEVVFDRAKGSLRVTIRDQLGMSRAVVVRSRLSATADFTDSRGPSGPNLEIPIAGAQGAEHVEYSLRLLDEHQNRVFEKGSDASPEIFQVAVAPTGPSGGARVLATKWLVIGIIGELIGVVGIAGGIGAVVVGNNAADRWNNDSICLANGKSRGANCGGDQSTANAAESGAIASFTIGGAFIVASTILLIAAPRTPREPHTASRPRLLCGLGPGLAGVACGGRF